MKRTLFSLLALLVAVAVAPWAQQSAGPADVAGTWTGTFDGDATGKLSFKFALDGSNQLGGTIEVSSDAGGGYTATFKTIDVSGAAVKLTYESPDDGANVLLEGTLDGAMMKGKWTVLEAGGTNSVATGTFSSTKS